MFEKYAAYVFEDFVRDESFVRWVLTPDTQSDQFWNDFQETFPYQRPVVRRAVRVVHNLSAASRTEPGRNDAEEIWNSISKTIAAPQQKRIAWWRRPAMAKIAAAILVTAGLAYFLVSEGRSSQQHTPTLSNLRADGFDAVSDSDVKEIVNTSEAPRRVVLADGSRVILQPEASIRVSSRFGVTSRNVHLIGEAFFEVERDAEKPFLVHANGLITKVLGTSFNVAAREGSDHVTVVVRTGKVTVFPVAGSPDEDPEAGGLILRANQQVDYSKKIEKFTRTLVAQPIPVLSPEVLQQFAFRNAAVTDIFKALEKVYDTEIVFDEELLSDCRLTSSLDGDMGLFEKLDVLCEAIDASYKVVDAHVVISGKKCQ